ncbi:MAG TPA: methyltransferase [Hyphomicrobiaceae bacterium]|nr:methyltransferase [Hyphomicrobiaceae bacterium]
MSTRFQRWAARMPLVRGKAAREAQAAFDLCAGFVYSQTLFASVKLGVLKAVADGPIGLEALVARTGLPQQSARTLINAAIALGLLSRRSHGRIGLGMRGAAISANPGIAAMVEHHAMLYADLADPVALLARPKADTRLAGYWPYAASAAPHGIKPDCAKPYSGLMTTSQSLLADNIIDAYPFHRHRRVLDVGGGEGAFLATLSARHPGLALHLFDLPAVVELAESRLASLGLGGRISTTGGDFARDPLPTGFDAATLIRVAHDHDDDRAVEIFANIRRALVPGGALVIAEPMSGIRGAERVSDVYFAFYLLAMGSGRPRSPGQLEELLRAAGFASFRKAATAQPMIASVLVASA